MWPLYVSQLASAAEVHPLTGALGEAMARRALYRAIAWPNVLLDAKDAFFAVDRSLYEAEVPKALRSGCLCVVDPTWPGLADLDPEARSRCLIPKDGDTPLLSYRRLAAFLRSRFDFPVVAVAGSNGKTTTKDMIAHVLGATRRVTATPGTNNGWVGVPITLCHPAHVASPDAGKNGACVLEIGIDEKGAMREHVRVAAPDVAVITALGPEHLAGLGTHEDAIREELEVFAGSKRRVWLAEDPALALRLARDVRIGDVVVRAQTTTPPCPHPDELTYAWRSVSSKTGSITIGWKGQTREVVVPMPGEHNGRNAALAIATALAVGSPFDETVDALATLRGPDQRCVVHELPSGIVLIDDSYNASPSSIEAALDVLETFADRERVVVLGDMLDLGAESEMWHRAIAPKISSLQNTHVRLFGENMAALAPHLGEQLLSIGRATPTSDPRALIDDLPFARGIEDAVVLVKGSRGMMLERVVRHLIEHDASPVICNIGVVGEGATALAAAIRAALAARCSDGMDETRKAFRVFVRTLTRGDLAQGEALRRPYHLALMSKLDLDFSANAVPPLEEQLALVAQLFVHVKRVAFLPSKTRDAVDSEGAEALELLADVVPPTARLNRFESESQLHEMICTEVSTDKATDR